MRLGTCLLFEGHTLQGAPPNWPSFAPPHWQAFTPPLTLYGVEKEARGSPPERRVQLRQTKAKLILDDLERWLQGELPKLSGKTPLANAIRYALTRMKRLRGYLDHGFLELDNNTAERSMRGIAIGPKNYMFVGSERGGKSAAVIYTLIETAKLNGVNPQACVRHPQPYRRPQDQQD